MDEMNELREQLAKMCHEKWSGWMDYLFSMSHGTGEGDQVIPAALATHWKMQSITPYEKLSEAEKKSDRALADKFLAMLEETSGVYIKPWAGGPRLPYEDNDE